MAVNMLIFYTNVKIIDYQHSNNRCVSLSNLNFISWQTFAIIVHLHNVL